MGLIIPSRATGEVFGPVGQTVSFGFVTDTHHDPIKATDPEQQGKYYMDAFNKVTDISAIFRARTDLAFCIQNGDFIDGSASANAALTDLATINTAFRVNVPKYHVLGNHEETRLVKEQIIAVTGQPSKWYSFVAGGVTFIVLDGNFSADDDTADLAITSVSGASPFVSYIPPTQRAWLAAEIAASLYPCVIICHYPVYYTGTDSWGLTNSAAVRTILEAAGTKVIGCVSGHLHDNFTRKINGIIYATLHATTAGPYPQLNYSIVTVYPKIREIKIKAYGYEMSHIEA